MAGSFRTRGQPAALRAVARAVARERAAHALLIVGPPGVGKTTLALDLAAGLLCLAEDPLDRPCRACAACRKLEHGNHPDLHRLAPHGAGRQIQIGDVRGLLAELALLPLEGRVRVALVEDAQRLNQDAQHAFLKILEEPPAGVTIVLTAEAESLLLETVVSRCQRLRAGPVDASVMEALLVDAGLADPSLAAELARAAGGRPGIALALAGRPTILLVEARLQRRLLDLLSSGRGGRLAAAPELLADAAELVRTAALTEGATEGAADAGDPADDDSPRRTPAAERRAAALRLIDVWRGLARDLGVVAAGGRAAVRGIGLLEELEAASAGLEPAAVAAFLARLDGLAAGIEGYGNPELAVDVLLLAWPTSRPAAA